MRSATATLLAVVALLVAFSSAVLQDGDGPAPYPAWLRGLVASGLALLPVYAALALYALWLRIDQHGWTVDRLHAALVALVLAGHAAGYAWAALRRDARWLARVPAVNRAMSLVLVALAVLVNSPVLDPQRIAVADQMARLDDGRTAPDDFDLDWLRHEAGRAGYEAALSLRTHPAWAGDAARLAELERVLARTRRWEAGPEEDAPPPDATALRNAVQPGAGATTPEPAWWNALAAGRFGLPACTRASADCILLTPDLDGDGQDDPLLCSVGVPHGVHCSLTARGPDGAWRLAATMALWPEDATPERAWRRALREDLLAGRLQAVPRRWPDLRIGERGVRTLEHMREETPVRR